jgi:prepilin-type processing-associated H-X9-DG protein
LLVVIAVIGVLAALLLPALSSARRKAVSLQCVNNLRQVAMATFLYCDDSDDYLPFAWYNNPSPKINNYFALLMPLIYQTDFDGYGDFEISLYACPARFKEPLTGPNPMRISYGMNAHNSIEYPDPRTWKLSHPQSLLPSATVMIADIAHTYNHPPLRSLQTNHAGYKHSTRANMVFFDGHASAHWLRQTNDLVVKF